MWGVSSYSSKYGAISLTLSSGAMENYWACNFLHVCAAFLWPIVCRTSSILFFNYGNQILYMLNHSADQLWPFPIVGEIIYRERGRETIRHGASEWKWPYFKNDKPNVCVSCSRVTADHFVVRDAPWSGLFLSVSTIGSKTGTECRPISR